MSETQYRNPLPVVVVMVCDENQGVLLAQRGIEPQRGSWALPAGYHEEGETWQEACSRELWEETDLIVDPSRIRLWGVKTVGEKLDRNLIFGFISGRFDIDLSFRNEETMGLKWTLESEPLAFPAHEDVLHEYIRSLRDSYIPYA